MVTPQFFNRRKQRKRLRQKSVCKSSLADNRNLTSVRIDLNHDFVLLQCIVDRVCGTTRFSVESTDNDIRFVNHVAIASKEASPIKML